MSTLELLKAAVETKYNELVAYTKAYNAKSELDKAKILDLKEKFAGNLKDLDTDIVGRDILFINGFHQVDVRKMQDVLLISYKLFRELGGQDDFSAEFLDTINILKASLPKQFFTLGPDGFVEIEAGRLEATKKDYTEKGYYKIYEEHLKKLLADE